MKKRTRNWPKRVSLWKLGTFREEEANWTKNPLGRAWTNESLEQKYMKREREKPIGVIL